MKPLNHSRNSGESVRPFNAINIDSGLEVSTVIPVEYHLTGENFPVLKEKEP